MKYSNAKFRTRIPAEAAQVFRWHERPGALERLIPPWAGAKVLERKGGLEVGGTVLHKQKLGPFWVNWLAEHIEYRKDQLFRDSQVRGPFRYWFHTHRFEPGDDRSSYLVDEIDYCLPFGSLGRYFGGNLVKEKIDRMFQYRHEVTLRDIEALQVTADRPAMKILITGATGLVGRSLSAFLSTGGHEAVGLVRQQGQPNSWNPSSGEIDAAALENATAVVHLAGENIASGRWNEQKKLAIRNSRVVYTRKLAESLAALKNPPKVLVCASAIGFYGDRGDEILTEESSPGTGFLPEISQEWEAACAPAVEKGIRVVNLRIGVILSPTGGALKKMLPPFKLGVGGVMGSGEQYYSWIALDDVLGAIHHALITESLSGPVNAVAPNPVTNREFTKTLGGVLKRPTIFPMPGFMARLAFGEMANDLILGSTRVAPERLQESGYSFRYPELEGALRHLLGK